MELTKNTRERFKNIKIEDETIFMGLHNALSKIDENAKEFITTFPRPNSINGIYPAIYNGGEWDDWTSGFWTGILWLAYEITKDEKYRKVASYQLRTYRDRMNFKIALNHHDIGFLYTPSVVANYKITKNEEAKNLAVRAADHLLTRFMEKGQFIQAWGEIGKKEDYRLIIDCNLNVPLLFFASEVTNDKKYADKATKHLLTAAKHVVRENGSTFHTYYFDNETGEPVRGATAQGKSDDSTWARGQAWGVYGFALAYRYLKDPKFIELYKQVTNVFINKLPKDDICYWDLDFDDNSGEEKDSSSAAIAICGILEMNKYLDDNDPDKAVYYNAAMAMLKSLILNYTTKDTNSNGLLKEAVYSKPHGSGVNECCIWGDYFYMEALIRYLKPDWNVYW